MHLAAAKQPSPDYSCCLASGSAYSSAFQQCGEPPIVFQYSIFCSRQPTLVSIACNQELSPKDLDSTCLDPMSYLHSAHLHSQDLVSLSEPHYVNYFLSIF